MPNATKAILGPAELPDKIQTWLEHLCLTIPNRHLGSAGNRAATDFDLITWLVIKEGG